MAYSGMGLGSRLPPPPSSVLCMERSLRLTDRERDLTNAPNHLTFPEKSRLHWEIPKSISTYLLLGVHPKIACSPSSSRVSSQVRLALPAPVTAFLLGSQCLEQVSTVAVCSQKRAVLIACWSPGRRCQD